MTVERRLAIARRVVASARADLAKAAAALGIALAIVGCDETPRSKACGNAPAPSSSAPIVIPASPEVKAAFARQSALFDRCRIGGGYPVWGLGYQAVCLKPQFVEWAEDPHFPEDK